MAHALLSYRGTSGIPCRPRSTTIVDLPPDVLLIIFRYVSKDAELPGDSNGIHSRLAAFLDPWPSHHDRYLDHPFPESLASIRPLWRSIMSNISIFWTRLVIWIGRDPTPLSRIHQYLSWSQDRPLDIYVYRRFDQSVQDPNEKARIDAIFELLLPHVKRWRTLHMHLLCSSSLPLPRVDLVGRADRLVTLVLRFIFDDLIDSTGSTSHLEDEFETPVLRNLFMGGVHFRESYVRPFPRLAMPPKLSSVAITDYNSHNVAFPLVDLLACLVGCTHLSSLELDSVCLDCSYTGPHIITAEMRLPRWSANVKFIDISGDVITEYSRLLDYPVVDSVSYRRCTTAVPLGATLTDGYNVGMFEIHSPTVLFSLLAAAPEDFSFCETQFEDCDGLTTDVLRKLAEPMHDPDAEAEWVLQGTWLCPNMKSIHVLACTQFRSADMRALLEARRRVHAATGFADADSPGFLVSSVDQLYVRGCCELAPEDEVWLDVNVPRVHWDDWKGGYDRPGLRRQIS
ncbi:uncharacterized protein B0H18DRAFT_1039357 [Fomitopsis serialis]|uniref:uncharacterized protein n=1 Tax=Fomitopsis serialis TaxID=139415 RepID=UPI00200869B1|nr:uncharacterized protein B0H18DRAFT_1039357 [Neoantrodia serialis]KAH9916032.1 hypothetical protein B0H18DRAFT_1039357 [Neoantrodia serialis]